jgi:hypothetical protein
MINQNPNLLQYYEVIRDKRQRQFCWASSIKDAIYLYSRFIFHKFLYPLLLISMPKSKTPGFINWRSSKPRAIILQDLEPGGVLVDMDHLKAELVWEYYKNLPDFHKVVFKQFKDRLAGHRKQASRDRIMARRDDEAVARDRKLIPREPHNERGELVFDMHPAKQLLRMDVSNGKHKILGPHEFRQSRPAYQLFKYKIFKCRIYQEVRRQKFLHWLELKRQKKLDVPPTSIVAFHVAHLPM